MRDSRGQGLVEYSIIIALVCVVAIVTLRTLGNSIRSSLWDMKDGFTCSHACSHDGNP